MAFGSEHVSGGEEKENKYGVMKGNQLASHRWAFNIPETVIITNRKGYVRWEKKYHGEGCVQGFLRQPHSSSTQRDHGAAMEDGTWTKAARPVPGSSSQTPLEHRKSDLQGWTEAVIGPENSIDWKKTHRASMRF